MKALLIGTVALLATACCGKKETAASGVVSTGEEGMPAMAETGPQVLVYSTREDHAQHVPVMLEEDGKTIASYPHPSDLKTANGLPVPTELGKGYLLDNRGIGRNVAFLDMSYAEYAALSTTPTLAELNDHIVDREPLLELYNCGPRTKYTDIAAELAKIVEADALGTRCKKLK
ncbi:MAG: hypothetical protein KDC00_05580 [Flavobacteriales bacterium]|nr:hypothetical protein [Flavobacteriales bacterium]